MIKLSIIIPFSTTGPGVHLPKDWPETDRAHVVFNTISVIKNINKKINISKEIIVVDNTNTFPDIKMDNLKVVKGLQYRSKAIINKWAKERDLKIDNLTNQTMWASIAYNVGIENAKGKYIVLQHNDFFYQSSMINLLINRLEKDKLGYISCDSKKITLSGYLYNKELIENLVGNVEINHEEGGYIKTKKLGFADCYFFLTKKSFFRDYKVDWSWGDSNHGATIKCIKENKGYIHMGPYYDNPNYESNTTERIYNFEGKTFGTHLKGGFSEHKYSCRIPKYKKLNTGKTATIHSPHVSNVNNFMKKLTDSIV